MQQKEKITISWDDLGSRRVNQRLKEQDALARQRQSQKELEEYEAMAAETSHRPSIWYNTIFSMAIFGLIGGLLAWGGGEALLRFRPDDRVEAAQLLSAQQEIIKGFEKGAYSAATAEASLKDIQHLGRNNAYFVIATDGRLDDAEKERRRQLVIERDEQREFIANVLSYGVIGLLLAMCLSMAEPIIDRNIPGMVITGSIGATLGLFGGIAVSLFVDPLYRSIESWAGNQIVARAVSYGVLGIFLAAAPGVVMKNVKKLSIGLAGGLVGGLLGGAVFDPIFSLTDNTQISKGIALVAIGVVAGSLTGYIENAAKTGWLRVASGLIAGKQFIIYRNPTFIGSSPECQVYLFKDRDVGRRHSAIHIIPGGFEIEDLPLGQDTFVNGKPVKRQRLRHGDQVRIGATTLIFQEKQREE